MMFYTESVAYIIYKNKNKLFAMKLIMTLKIEQHLREI